MPSMISRIGKLNEVKKTKSVDAFFISSASSVKYFSGFFFYFEYGYSPFHLLPAILMVLPDQDASLVLADNEMSQSDAVDPLITVLPYASYAYEQPAAPAEKMLNRIYEFIQKNRLGAARIGIERDTLPFSVTQTMSELFPSIVWMDISADIIHLKMVKDKDEIENIRQAAALSDIGQEAVLKYARTGMTELELFSLAHHDIEKSVGLRVPLMADLSSGIHTNSGGGMPTNNIIHEGDVILSDFQACLQGYWGDSCSTLVVGRPTADQQKTFMLVSEALEIGIQAMKPGVQAHEIDQLMRAHIGNYPHHSGHGVGTLYHEAPRITPYNKIVLETGMIIALEPAVYKEAWGIRLEHLMLVTDLGAQVLTTFRHRLQQ